MRNNPHLADVSKSMRQVLTWWSENVMDILGTAALTFTVLLLTLDYR